ncbi:MAG: nif-specific transcriptional activator NifA [Nitrospirae bacterium]|nr:MAG: nif-specific transcriptional activator NifA [Nitrospirota bacterium]
MGNMAPVTDLDESRSSEECEVLEAVAAALADSGPVPQRLERAIQLVDERLRVVRSRLAGVEPAGEASRHRAAAGRNSGLLASLVGQSEAMREVYEAIRRVSGSQATVLLRGESGTGKELVAKAIHVQGIRARGPFIRLHCAAVTESLLESELFGHERGAFTGAVDQRKGRFELADGGTLFLDEVGDIPPSVQVKLLRVLQDKCFERVGGSRLLSVDVRLISATHRDLEAMVRAGTFREDLYYRLNVVPVTLPPLRERIGDIPLLIDHFLDRFNRENGRHVRLGRDLMALMTQYEWPGNVRELQNCVERLVVMTEPRADLVTLDSVPSSLRGYFADMEHVTGVGREKTVQGHSIRKGLDESIQGLERQRLLDALERVGWVQARAARVLRITPRQVAYKIKKYGIVEASRNEP